MSHNGVIDQGTGGVREPTGIFKSLVTVTPTGPRPVFEGTSREEGNRILRKAKLNEAEVELFDQMLFKPGETKLTQETLSQVLSGLLKMVKSVDDGFTEMFKAAEDLTFEEQQEHIVGCSSLIEAPTYDMDAVADEIGRKVSVPPERDVISIIIPLIRSVLPGIIAREIVGAQPMSELQQERDRLMADLRVILAGPPHMQVQQPVKAMQWKIVEETSPDDGSRRVRAFKI